MHDRSHSLHPTELTTALKLLFGQLAAGEPIGELDWAALLPLTRSNAVLVRLADRLAELGAALPVSVAEAVATERRRVRAALDVMTQVERNCERHGIPYLFPKALQHYPDMGHALDLVVLGDLSADRHILGDISVVACERTLVHRLAHVTTYLIVDHDLELDVQHGRLGALGEDERFARTLVHATREVVVEGRVHRAPTIENTLLLLALQKIWGRAAFRLADVLLATELVSHATLDWEALVRREREVNAPRSLSCFLAYVEQIHTEVTGRPLLSHEARRVLSLDRWGRAEFRAKRFRFPVWRVHARTLGTRVFNALGSRDWRCAARLGLLPALLSLRGLGSATRRISAPCPCDCLAAMWRRRNTKPTTAWPSVFFSKR